MNILDYSCNVPMDTNVRVRRYFPNGEPKASDDAILKEHVLGVHINDMHVANLVCTPSHLVELVLGRLLTEGCISSIEDVSQVVLQREAESIYVTVNNGNVALPHNRAGQVASTGDALQHMSESPVGLSPVAPHPWSAPQIFRAIEAFEGDSPLHVATNCVHSCYLFENGSVRYCCEDIGRHNAFDKVIGCAMRDGVNLSETFVFTSGRVPLDMVTKAIRAGIPMLISKAAPTDLTVQKAMEYGLTLVGLAHADSFCLYTEKPVTWI